MIEMNIAQSNVATVVVIVSVIRGDEEAVVGGVNVAGAKRDVTREINIDISVVRGIDINSVKPITINISC